MHNGAFYAVLFLPWCAYGKKKNIRCQRSSFPAPLTSIHPLMYRSLKQAKPEKRKREKRSIAERITLIFLRND